MKFLFELFNLSKLKQIHILGSLFEVIMLIFLDYIFLVRMGINVHEKFLSSWGAFIYNILSSDFFIATFGILILYVLYYAILPLLLPLMIFRLFAVILTIINLGITILQKIAIKITEAITKQKINTNWNPSFRQSLEIWKLIIIQPNGDLVKGKRFSVLIDLLSDLRKDDGIYEFFIRCTSLFSATLYILISFHVTNSLIIFSGILLFLSLTLAYIFSLLVLKTSEIEEIISISRNP